MERERHGIRGSRDTTEHLAEELADVVICADLIAMSVGVDLGQATIDKFNATSEKVDLPTRLYPTPDERTIATLEAALATERTLREDAEAALAEARRIVGEQATDHGLWFVAETLTEDTLQKALRQLHTAVEGVSPEDAARAALTEASPAQPESGLRETLAPFVRLADLLDAVAAETYTPDSDAIIAVRPSQYSAPAVTVGDLRRLREAYNASQPALAAPAGRGSETAAIGWAVQDSDGRLDLATCGPTRRSAIVNWLVTNMLAFVTTEWDDERIESAWLEKKRRAEVVAVAVSALPRPADPQPMGGR